MMIVFVYDTAKCCKEEDDPADAVMYFHPAWVSPTQRIALAGQLMGVNQFLSTSFSSPSIISLQGGKFVLKKFGTYILAIGTDRNIQDWILERRADILESLLKFFHCDFEKILISVNNERNKFTEKLYQIFEIYLPILQYNASLFSNLPMLKLPRSASNIFLEAMHILQYCQETNGIVGGALFYNNKVVASQLSADITKLLVITDPYRIKVPADKIMTNFHLPVGVQLFHIFVEQRQFFKLIQEANMERGYSSYLDSSLKQSIHKKSLSKASIKDQPISIMKRDTSRIFTVPEEAELDATYYNMTHCIPTLYPSAYNSVLKRKEETINRSERQKCQHPLTPSVCSTPLKDVNRVLHGFAVSICATSEEIDTLLVDNEKDKSKSNGIYNDNKGENIDDIPDIVKEALQCKRLNKFKNAIYKKKMCTKDKNISTISSSLTNIEESLQKHSNKIVFKTYGLGLPKLNHNVCVNNEMKSPKKCKQRRFYNTITDPYYPIFRTDGLPASQALYDEYISNHYQELNNTSRLTEFSFDISTSLSHTRSDKFALNNCKNETDNNPIIGESNVNINIRLDNKAKQKTYRRSMNLPLKPLNNLDNEEKRKSASECNNIFDLPQRRKFDGLQLTPLMSKLSLLANEKTSGFCSREITPSELREFSSYPILNSKLVKSKFEAANDEISSDNDDEISEDSTIDKKDEGNYEKGEMFLCGYQNMVLFLLMEDGTANDPELIHSLWETCINILGCLEKRLQQCLEPFPSNESRELYSVLSVDSDWDTTLRSGLWGVTELDIVSSLHNKFRHNNNLTDIIVRTDDTVVYGNQCGNIEVFYQQAIAPSTIGGLPTPADLMGIVPLKAKRRLERDHMIIIL